MQKSFNLVESAPPAEPRTVGVDEIEFLSIFPKVHAPDLT